MNKVWVILICLILLFILLFYVTRQTKSTPEVNVQPISSKSSESLNLEDWKEFKPQSGLFKVLFPNPPQYAKDFVPISGSDKKRRYDVYASEKIDGTLFLISVITYPEDENTDEPFNILKLTIDELMHAKPDNELTKLKESLFKTQRSLDFSFVNKDFHVEGKVFMIGKMIYVLSYVTQRENFNRDEFHHFVNSFELLNQTNLEE